MAIVSRADFKSISWHKSLVLALSFWISSSILLDFVIMPSLFAAGMMSQADFATAGYGIFWIFNRLELLCAAFVLTAVLVRQQSENAPISTVLAGALFAITIACTYFLSPQMSSLGLNLNWFEPAHIPAGMNQLHVAYWVLEASKLLAGSWLLKREF
ncbi:DUF4149 domain-containing protein [Leptolyngbya sp. FACHB-17]|uniref:DUF4149 domain-containing protein n=1 Tax=unclassified Leptolyngbya TaxID=2650499 RepID=UPI0016802EB1|nr:DUF4149 domain-containing protein [Leptolyngbya sp. FACHB-17]MBD2081694.1 DUF4149 domain-containing protein [Leptolyngbya sp. FACHB-17]